jgi:hypothetical protein
MFNMASDDVKAKLRAMGEKQLVPERPWTYPKMDRKLTRQELQKSRILIASQHERWEQLKKRLLPGWLRQADRRLAQILLDT